MNEIFADALAVITMMIGGWVVVFAPIGAILARNRGVSPLTGLLLGGTLGPFGWVVVLLTTMEAPVAGTHPVEDGYDIWAEL